MLLVSLILLSTSLSPTLLFLSVLLVLLCLLCVVGGVVVAAVVVVIVANPTLLAKDRKGVGSGDVHQSSHVAVIVLGCLIFIRIVNMLWVMLVVS